MSGDGEISGGFDLTEAGTQKRLAIYLVRDVADVPGIARLGPDPTDPEFTRESFDAVLDAAGKRRLKTLLRDQSVLAGVGNAYSDEILHAAKLSPAAAAGSLTDDTRSVLYDAMTEVLTTAVESARQAAPRRTEGRQALRYARARPRRPTLPGVWGHDPVGEHHRHRLAVLPHMSDRRHPPGRPPPAPPPEVAPAAGGG